MRDRIQRFVFLIALAIMSGAAVSGAAEINRNDPKALWEAIRKKWDSSSAYSCDLFSWGYRTPWFIKNFPEVFNKDEKPKPVWHYRVYNIRYKKPDKVLFSYDLSLKENIEAPGLIDKAIAYVLLYVPGIQLNYGWKDKQKVYIKFPDIPDFNKLNIPGIWRVAAKILVDMSKSEYYVKDREELNDSRGYGIKDLNMGYEMKLFEHYFKDGTVTVEPAHRFKRNDFDLNKRSGWLSINEAKAASMNILKFVMTPNDAKKNRGITKIEMFVDPSIPMIVGMHEYEQDKLVNVMHFENLKLNVEFPDSLWVKWFEGRNLSTTNEKSAVPGVQ